MLARNLTAFRSAPKVGAVEPIVGVNLSTIDFLLTERQQKMLRALLLHPDRQYGSNELIAIGGPGTGAGRRILDRFEQSAIVVKSARGNQRLYSVNTRHPIYAELRSICMKTFGIADVIAEELALFKDSIDLAFVFGSLAEGAERPNSDVDLMVVGRLDVFDLGEPIERIERALGRQVDLNLHTPEEWKALQGDHITEAILKKKKIVVFEE